MVSIVEFDSGSQAVADDMGGAPAGHHQTADLLEALRRRRGERDPMDLEQEESMAAHPTTGTVRLIDIPDEQARMDLARSSVMALSFVAQSARGLGLPAVPQTEVDRARTITERFMIRWRGEPDPKHVQAVDAYWVSGGLPIVVDNVLIGAIGVGGSGLDEECANAGLTAVLGPQPALAEKLPPRNRGGAAQQPPPPPR